MSSNVSVRRSDIRKLEDVFSACVRRYAGDLGLSMVYGGLVWPTPSYCASHQAFDYDYMYPYAIQPSQPMRHVDLQHYPAVGEHWNGIHIYENCKYCFQRLVATGDAWTNYCPRCGAYQFHRV